MKTARAVRVSRETNSSPRDFFLSTVDEDEVPWTASERLKTTTNNKNLLVRAFGRVPSGNKGTHSHRHKEEEAGQQPFSSPGLPRLSETTTTEGLPTNGQCLLLNPFSSAELRQRSTERTN